MCWPPVYRPVSVALLHACRFKPAHPGVVSQVWIQKQFPCLLWPQKEKALLGPNRNCSALEPNEQRFTEQERNYALMGYLFCPAFWSSAISVMLDRRYVAGKGRWCAVAVSSSKHCSRVGSSTCLPAGCPARMRQQQASLQRGMLRWP